eukprot:scaffold159467_cov27-Tisochrysis_lutea.AAC.5
MNLRRGLGAFCGTMEEELQFALGGTGGEGLPAARPEKRGKRGRGGSAMSAGEGGSPALSLSLSLSLSLFLFYLKYSLFPFLSPLSVSLALSLVLSLSLFHLSLPSLSSPPPTLCRQKQETLERKKDPVEREKREERGGRGRDRRDGERWGEGERMMRYISVDTEEYSSTREG